jgi:long-chain acyl-CoA synthetase
VSRARPTEGALEEAAMEKIWLRHYPPGVPGEVDYGQNPSIGELFEATVAKYAARPAYTNMGKTISFGDLGRM